MIRVNNIERVHKLPSGIVMGQTQDQDYVLVVGTADRPDLAMWRKAKKREVIKLWDYIWDILVQSEIC